MGLGKRYVPAVEFVIGFEQFNHRLEVDKLVVGVACDIVFLVGTEATDPSTDNLADGW